MTKTIYSPKTDNQNNFCSGTPLKTCRADAKIPPKEKSGPERLVGLRTSCTLCNVLAQHTRDPPKGLVTALSNKANSSEQARWWKNTDGFTTFQNSMFMIWNCKRVGSRCQRAARGGRRKKKKEGTPGSPISWKLICDPLMKSSSFGIKLNIQRYLSVGISLIALREVSDRLMQVLTWASPRILYMYPATDRYC